MRPLAATLGGVESLPTPLRLPQLPQYPPARIPCATTTEEELHAPPGVAFGDARGASSPVQPRASPAASQFASPAHVQTLYRTGRLHVDRR
jgi:hypothetical protein